MRRHVTRGYVVLRTEGLGPLVSKAAAFARKSANGHYWNLRGERSLSYGGTTATFDSRGRTSHSLNYFHANEAVLVEEMLREARPDDVLWDVGANVGFHSAFVGQRVGDVVAFEPEPETAHRLADTLRRNAVTGTVRAQALSDADGELELTGDISPNIAPAETVTRPAYAGDTLIREEETPPPTMLKIDVEGAEGDVLKGMSDALDGCRVVYVEVHRPTGERRSIADFGYEVGDIEELLCEAGFDVEWVTDRETEFHLKASRPE